MPSLHLKVFNGSLLPQMMLEPLNTIPALLLPKSLGSHPSTPPLPMVPLNLAALSLSLHCSHSKMMGNALLGLCTPFLANLFHQSVLTSVVASSRQPSITIQDGAGCPSPDSSLFPMVVHCACSSDTIVLIYFTSTSPINLSW